MCLCQCLCLAKRQREMQESFIRNENTDELLQSFKTSIYNLWRINLGLHPSLILLCVDDEEITSSKINSKLQKTQLISTLFPKKKKQCESCEHIKQKRQFKS